MLQTLFIHSLLPPKLCQLEDFLSGSTSIPLKSSPPQPAREERRAESGLLSTLSSYLLSPYGSSTDALIQTSSEDIESTLSAIDCISSCKLDVLYEQIL
jgi:brefeldin A-resistance guanine nucleotide exchange factor 1